MSLKYVHLIFISMATLLLAGCAVWCFLQSVGGLAFVLAGVVTALCTVGLIIYGVLFWKKINRIIT